MPFSWFREATFTERLKKVRVARGLTQKQLALKAGLSHDLVWRWERALHGANAEHLDRVSKVLGVTSGYLRTGVRSDQTIGAIVGNSEVVCAQ